MLCFGKKTVKLYKKFKLIQFIFYSDTGWIFILFKSPVEKRAISRLVEETLFIKISKKKSRQSCPSLKLSIIESI
jgi:hypothetical protein